jgi:hypothetical protein
VLNGYRKAALIIALGMLAAGRVSAELPAVKLVTSPLVTPARLHGLTTLLQQRIHLELRPGPQRLLKFKNWQGHWAERDATQPHPMRPQSMSMCGTT